MEINLEINLDLWIAKDKYGGIVIFNNKPKRSPTFSFWHNEEGAEEVFNAYCIIRMFPNIENYLDFSLVRWEDGPKQLKDILIKEHE